jgi:hypothetical protein
MSRTLSIIGIVLTVAYLGVLWFVFDGRLVEILLMAPNEIGDLLAGVFGPLAILWLILGFFQQGIELRQNTRALELQADELRNTVDQQRELVAVSKRQFEADLESMRQDLERQRLANQPNFVFHVERATLDQNDQVHTTMTIENIGATVINVEFSWGGGITNPRIRDITTFETGRKVNFSWAYKKSFPRGDLWLAIDFTNGYGERNRLAFDFLPGGDDGLFNGLMVRRKNSNSIEKLT